MSSSTPGTLSAIRRLKQVYVEIPPSPLHRNSPSFSKLLPQNMPLSPTRSNMPVAPTHKRKLSNATQPVSKKQKVDVGSQKENSSNNITKEQSGPTAFYCHQCSKKRDASERLSRPREERTGGAEEDKQKSKSISQPMTTSKPSGAESSTKSTKLQVKKPSAKRLPVVEWTNDAEARMQIREFVLRFDQTVGKSIVRSDIEELERIGEVAENDEEAPSAWVSEACVKAVILGLLGTLADEEDSSAATVIKAAIKQVRSAGVNLNKIWVALAALRESLDYPDDDAKSAHSNSSESSEDRIIITFPDPLPPPEGMTANYNTRSSRSSAATTPSDVNIVSTMQLIPVINGLIETVIESHTIREELDGGFKRCKEITKNVRENIKKENEKWEQIKKDIEANADAEVSISLALPGTWTINVSPKGSATKLKEARQTQKDNVQNLEHILKVLVPSCAPRFGPLGTDHDGRIYYALSPGVRDREFAANLLAGASKRTKGRKPIRRAKSVEARKAFQEWSWFLAVWGHHPSSIESEPGWWVFWEPEEIRKLATWISDTNDLGAKSDSDESAVKGAPPASHSRLRSLTKNLQEYATALEWRCKGDAETL
ncbi:hypothetical protein VNI00_011789 [Paramarasmius palmivorus]|uniref:Uncharacterized protein n=1 Tax=Paramarasmius palmivorus TaxID=297713 RepID=A0AAW0CC37_9AGAR